MHLWGNQRRRHKTWLTIQSVEWAHAVGKSLLVCALDPADTFKRLSAALPHIKLVQTELGVVYRPENQ